MFDAIRESIAQGKTTQALEMLVQWAQANNRPDQLNGIALWKADLSRTEREYSQGLVTDADRRVVQQRVARGVLDLLDELGAGRPAFHAFHCYTCDRIEQSDTFTEVFERKRTECIQFYFLYGWERQSHLGMFRRLAYEREGAFLDDLSPDTPTTCRARQLELRLRPTRKEQVFKLEIIKNLFHLLELTPEDHEPLLDKNLAYIAQHSPLLQELSPKDYLCIYIPILSYDWDTQITPAVARWLLESFCKDALPTTAPTFLFFFAVVFEEDDDALVGEIRQIVEASTLITPIPELDKVPRRDIRRWLSMYHQLAPTTEARDQLAQHWFGTGQDPVDMEIVELNLRKIIDQFNNASLS